jgi:hypothetical protein
MNDKSHSAQGQTRSSEASIPWDESPGYLIDPKAFERLLAGFDRDALLLADQHRGGKSA